MSTLTLPFVSSYLRSYLYADVRLELGLKVFERRFLGHEGRVGIRHVVLPQVLVLEEGREILLHLCPW